MTYTRDHGLGEQHTKRPTKVLVEDIIRTNPLFLVWVPESLISSFLPYSLGFSFKEDGGVYLGHSEKCDENNNCYEYGFSVFCCSPAQRFIVGKGTSDNRS